MSECPQRTQRPPGGSREQRRAHQPAPLDRGAGPRTQAPGLAPAGSHREPERGGRDGAHGAGRRRPPAAREANAQRSVSADPRMKASVCGHLCEGASTFRRKTREAAPQGPSHQEPAAATAPAHECPRESVTRGLRGNKERTSTSTHPPSSFQTGRPGRRNGRKCTGTRPPRTFVTVSSSRPSDVPGSGHGLAERQARKGAGGLPGPGLAGQQGESRADKINKKPRNNRV